MSKIEATITRQYKWRFSFIWYHLQRVAIRGQNKVRDQYCAAAMHKTAHSDFKRKEENMNGKRYL